MHQPMCYYRNIYSDVFEVNINMIKINVENKADTEYVLNAHTHSLELNRNSIMEGSKKCCCFF